MAVRIDGRPFAAVQADLIEGLVTVNDVHGAEASGLRRRLWNALDVADQVEPGGVVVALDADRRRRHRSDPSPVGRIA